LNYQNIYVTRSNKLLEYQNVLQHFSLILRFQQNYFCWSNEIIFRSISSKILDPSSKLFFLCKKWKKELCDQINYWKISI